METSVDIFAPFRESPVFLTPKERQEHGIQITQDMLEEIEQQHKLWLQDKLGNKGKRADFSHCNLRRLHFHKMCFDKADFSDAVLDSVFFNDCSVRNAKFDHSMFLNASFEDAEGEEASFVSCDLDSVDFNGADLKSSNFNGASFRRCNFSVADLTKAQLNGISATLTFFNSTILSYASFIGATFTDTFFVRSVFVDTLLMGTTFQSSGSLERNDFMSSVVNCLKSFKDDYDQNHKDRKNSAEVGSVAEFVQHGMSRKLLYGILIIVAAIFYIAYILATSEDSPKRNAAFPASYASVLSSIENTNTHKRVALPASDPEAPKLVSDYEKLVLTRLSEKIKGMTLQDIQKLPSNETFKVEQRGSGTYIICKPLNYKTDPLERPNLTFLVSVSQSGLVLTPSSDSLTANILSSQKTSTKLPGDIILPF